jgi:pimeloyl-ACP methyl ester carboxylesterase
VAGVVRALGAPSAVVVGHDWGGWVAWSMPGLQPKVTSAVAVLGMGHPLTMRSSFTLGRQRRAAARLLAFQAPLAPERSFERRDGVRTVLEAWSGPGWPDDETVETYTRAMRVPFVAHSSLEYYRWAVRSLGRRDGRRFAAGISAPVAVPVLQLQGGLDPWVLPESAALSVRQVAGAWRYELLPTAGHYLAEEAPDAVTALLLDWLSGLPARHGRAPAAAPVPGRQRPGEIVPVSRPSRSGPSRPPRWR